MISERERRCQFLNEKFNEVKNKDLLLKQLCKSSKKNEIYLIRNSFYDFKKDLKAYRKLKITRLRKEQRELCELINENIKNIPIFELENGGEFDVDLKLIPFKKFFISSIVNFKYQEELYTINGFFCFEMEGNLIVNYFWGKIMGDGGGLNSFAYNKDVLLKENINEFEGILTEDFEQKIIQSEAHKSFHFLIKKLIYKIIKREYNQYKIYQEGSLKENKIVFSSDVKSHKRHFWKDSGRFKIPLMDQIEWEEKGYGTDRIVVRDGEIRENVPFTIIGGLQRQTNKENKKYSFIKKKIWKQEERVYDILKELFQKNYIKRNDRRRLKGLELDFYIHDLKLGIEYDGEQHFIKEICEKVFKSDFEDQKKRDRIKNKLCKRKNVILVRIKYDEPLTKTHIKNKIKRMGIEI